MLYYKIMHKNEVIGIHSGSVPIPDDDHIQVDFDEYSDICHRLGIECEEYDTEENPEYDRVSELEAEVDSLERENAALLYELLTGEVFVE